MNELLDDIISRVTQLDDKTRAGLAEAVLAQTGHLKHVPNPGPQTDAYLTLADVLLYGGQAGGGKSGLILLLALQEHERSLLMRRQYSDVNALIEDCLRKHGSRRGFSGAPPARLRLDEHKQIEFGGAKMPGDEEHWKGQPHDLLAIDEASQFLESQVRFLMGWVRSDTPGQRCRVILASNPPEKPAEGQWLLRMFGPWLDKTHRLYPAQPGELLWCVTDEDGNDRWVDGPEPIEIGGKMVRPLSRTFIPAALKDNPFLADTDYGAKLDALPEPLRSAVRDGNWMIAHQDDAYQIIPTNWVLAAQERWTREPPKAAPMCSIGVDVAQGGADETVLQCRYDTWFAEPIAVPGRDTPQGTDVAALVVKYRRHKAHVIIDMGGGYGGSAYDHLQANLDLTTSAPVVHAFKGAGASSARTADRQLTYYNKRAEVWWRFREALDPGQDGGSPIMLPPDADLAADLVSPRFEVTPRGIKVEDKAEIIKRLGRSPDRGDAAVMAWNVGETHLTHGQIWRDAVKTRHQPTVHHGYANRKRRRR